MLNADAKSLSLGSLVPRFQHDLACGFRGPHTIPCSFAVFTRTAQLPGGKSYTGGPSPYRSTSSPSPQPVSTLWWPFFSDYSPLRVLHMPPGRFPQTIRSACTDFTHADVIKAPASNHILRRMVRHVNVWCATVSPLEWTFQGYTTQKGSNMCTNDCCFPGYNLMRLEDEIIATITHAFFFFFWL